MSNSFRREPEPVIQQQHEPHPDEFENENHLVNWSETHECRPKRFYQPETHEELETLVAEAHAKGETRGLASQDQAFAGFCAANAASYFTCSSNIAFVMEQ